jgi:hypothetical protein
VRVWRVRGEDGWLRTAVDDVFRAAQLLTKLRVGSGGLPWLAWLGEGCAVHDLMILIWGENCKFD